MIGKMRGARIAAEQIRWQSERVSRDLNARQARFASEYLIDLNGKQAAIRAGYNPRSAEVTASRLLSGGKVAARIAELQGRREARLEIRADDILRELLTFARADIGQAFDGNGRLLPIHQMPEDVRRAISGIETEELWSEGEDRVPIGQVRKVKFWDKTRGLELLGKHLKLFTERVEHAFPELTDEQLEARKREIIARDSAPEPLH